MSTKPTLTCVVPARNEAGHLEQLVQSILSVEAISRVVIVEGGSTDSTYEIAVELSKLNPNRVTCTKQTGKGKFNAVLEGASMFKSDFTMIWDADGTVPVESSRMIIKSSLDCGSLSMGDRLRGEISPGAMQFANRVGNWLFAIAWSPINRIKPTDIFCGTKVAPSEVFTNVPQKLISNDPYGDIALLLTARQLGIKITPTPVKYTARIYGESKMRRWKMGFIFLKLTCISYSQLLIKSSFIKK
jgi:glycosyltransferase involved in cell wall biosynthesis